VRQGFQGTFNTSGENNLNIFDYIWLFATVILIINFLINDEGVIGKLYLLKGFNF
jgi:hypothetical protein